jgi:hypothetical protein
MCSPSLAIAGISAGLGAVQSGMQYAGARQQYKMQVRAAQQQAELQKQSIAFAQKKAAIQVTTAQLERQQQKEAIAQEKGKVAKRGQAAVARAVVAAGEAGVSGLSVQALMDDYIRQQAGQVAALTTQDKLYALRHGLNLEQLAMASEQEIRGLSQPIQQPGPKPSALGAGLGILQAGLGGYGTYKSLRALERPSFIDTGMGVSSYMPDTDQYTLPARGPLAIGGR